MEDYEDLGAFLEHVSLVMDNDANEDAEKVTIMTIHAAKGLEFDHVFLPGWEEGVFPSQRSLDEGGLASLEEERRLAYVAITRARRLCTIMHAANRRIYGQWTSSIPSRFVAELPKDHINEESSLSGGASMWRAQWSERDDPFAHLARDKPERSQSRAPVGSAPQRRPSMPPRVVFPRALAARPASRPSPGSISARVTGSRMTSSGMAPSPCRRATGWRSISIPSGASACWTVLCGKSVKG